MHATAITISTCVLLVVVAPLSTALAESRDAKAFGKKPEARVTAPSERAGGMKPCPEYGAGFYRLSGSDTCVRVSGGAGIDVGTSGVRR